MLYNSLRSKIMTLPDHVIVYPAHGAGSACGKNMSNETTDLLGNQKKTNYALRSGMTREAFIREVTEGLLPPPQYFAMNKGGAKSLDDILKKGNIPLDTATFMALADHEGAALVLDTRTPREFAAAHIPNAIFIGLDGSFAPWVGALIPDLQQPVIFIAEPGREEEVIVRLSRVGYDNTLGYLKGGIHAWRKAGNAFDTVMSVSAGEFAVHYKKHKLPVLDVRKPTEYEAENVEDALNLPLDSIDDHFNQLDRHKAYYLYCAGGYRSMIYASILKSRGYDQLVDIACGFKAIAETDVPKTEYVCPSSSS